MIALSALAVLALGVVAAESHAQAASLRWPAQAGAVRFAPERDYGPFVYVEADGQVAGLSVDILQRLARDAGLPLTTLPADTLDNLLAQARAGQVDLITSLRPTPERATYLAFTSPYVNVPAVLVVRDGAQASGLAGLKGQKVAVGKGYAVEADMRRRHPEVAWQAVSDDVAALREVASGHQAAAVVDAASLAFIQRRHALRGLRAAEQVGFDYALSFAVRKDLPELLAVLEDGIRRLPPPERDALVARWMQPLGEDAPQRAPWATRLAWGLLALAGVGLAWRLLRQQRTAG